MKCTTLLHSALCDCFVPRMKAFQSSLLAEWFRYLNFTTSLIVGYPVIIQGAAGLAWVGEVREA